MLLPVMLAATVATSSVPDLRLAVDTSDIVHKVLTVHEAIQVQPGPLILRYPQWVQGHHAPTGKVANLAGLHFSAGGRVLSWRRDPADPFAFRLSIPAGTSTLTADFTCIGALDRRQGDTFSSTSMVRVQWHVVSLYPAGRRASDLSVEASLTIPKGWQVASALPQRAVSPTVISFERTDYETLLDAPAYAARYLGRTIVSSPGERPVTINVVGESDAATDISPAQMIAAQRAFEQARRLFGSEPYQHYDFIVALSSHLSTQGLEHRQSSEDSLPGDYFTDPVRELTNRNLLLHEYIHAWNGKLHRPDGLAVSDPNTPLNDSLLWVYEGLTKYLDKILAVRGGLWTPALGDDAFAASAADIENEPGRTWRPLEDTTVQPIIGEAEAWQDWSRSQDYYEEGAFLWLGIDARIRSLTSNRRSLDDFIRAFFGADPDARIRPYDFGMIVAALDKVAPADWAAFLQEQLQGMSTATAVDALKRAGYRLIYSDQPSEWTKSLEARNKALLLDYSLGATIAEDGSVRSVRWGAPAFTAGILPGDRIMTIAGQPFTPDRLRAAVAATSKRSAFPRVGIDSSDGTRSVQVDRLHGLRYPHLQPIGAGPRMLDKIMQPL